MEGHVLWRKCPCWPDITGEMDNPDHHSWNQVKIRWKSTENFCKLQLSTFLYPVPKRNILNWSKMVLKSRKKNWNPKCTVKLYLTGISKQLQYWWMYLPHHWQFHPQYPNWANKHLFSPFFFDDLKFSNSLGLSSTVSCLFSKEDFVCKFGGNVWNLHQTSYPISLQCNQTWRQKWRVCWFLVVFWKKKNRFKLKNCY